MKNFLERASDYKHSTNNFKFYVSANQDLQDFSSNIEEVEFEKKKPKLLENEIIIAEGNRVLFFPNVADKTKGLLGNLYVTNFRFLFNAYEDHDSDEGQSLYQNNFLLGKHGSCLSNIETIHQLLGEKKRRLFQDSQLTEKVKGLQIICKNMKVFTFNFDHSPITQGKNIAKTLLHHAFPGRHHLLFAYDFRNGKTKNDKMKTDGVVLFSEKSEWENELLRTCSLSASNWRVSAQNQRFQMSTSLPKWLIIPHCVLDCDFVTASQSFRCSRPPIWTWSSPNGAALVRMADLLPTITDRTQENRMLEYVRKCHPHLKGPCIKYLDKDLPSVSDLNISYSKLRDLCTPDSLRQFKAQDLHLYSALESTKWLQYVSTCLKIVIEAVQEIQNGISVVLQESDGRDMSAVISSLVQLALDPHSRSIVGFQSLVQKEWVALGHPFCKRLGHLGTDNSEQSPVFLFFLDCVWQFQNQFPENFEFTETYLTTLWDSVHISIFDTFLFDCEKERADATLSPSDHLELRSVWNWSYQFSNKDIELFVNPLFEFRQLRTISRDNDKAKAESALLPNHFLPYIELWTQCYFRWLPLLSIKCGGKPQVDIVHRRLMSDIKSLLNEIQGHLKKNDEFCFYNSVGNSNSSSYKNHRSNDKSPIGNKKYEKNIVYSINSKSGTSSNNSEENRYNLSNLSFTDLSGEVIVSSNDTVLWKNRDFLDNFFPFDIGNRTCISGSLANSSNISEFDTQSVLNLTE